MIIYLHENKLRLVRPSVECLRNGAKISRASWLLFGNRVSSPLPVLDLLCVAMKNKPQITPEAKLPRDHNRFCEPLERDKLRQSEADSLWRWFQKGKYRTVIHRHDGTFVAADESERLTCHCDSLRQLANTLSTWPIGTTPLQDADETARCEVNCVHECAKPQTKAHYNQDVLTAVEMILRLGDCHDNHDFVRSVRQRLEPFELEQLCKTKDNP